MNIVSSKRKMGLSVSEIEKDIIEEKISNLISLFTILLLVCVIIITSALVFELVREMYTTKQETINYTMDDVEEEPLMFKIGL